MKKTVSDIVDEEIKDFLKTDEQVMDEIISIAEELEDPNGMISYIPQGYVHKILDED